MKVLQKWSYEAKEYKNYYIPKEWHTPCYTENMKEIVNCVQCGKEQEYGECYTSKEIHGTHGLGYGVCEKCYQEEMIRWRKDKDYECNRYN